ncbi:MAG TPA: tetratricopeptide repeat protein [Sphingopyxis sp.]|uniref:tetratricopeptide repeat protein n=1 Tax=Sphingopyxis sp. TaxID=1908224 RepID=UPI002E34D2C9|nr:tetratricopeptide repeat protein [Sphingopyxis sp.]HEX2813452.1 tetratricopeptide repeat protein [Sphingopyxis sp.]
MFTRFRPMSATAMAAILGCSMMAMTAPAAAKEKPKKEEAAKGPSLSPSKAFEPAGKKMQDAAKKKDAAALQAAVTEGQSVASSNDDKYFLGFYTLQLGILNKDEALQEQGLDTALDSGFVPAADAGLYNFYSGRFAYVKKDYPKAIKRFEAAKAAGSAEEALPTLLMDSYLNAGQVDQGLAIAKAGIEAAHAAGRPAPEDLYVRPAKALQAAKRTDDLLDILTLRVRDYPQPEIWRNTLYILLQQVGGDKDLNLDILRLMRATGAMTDRGEYLEYTALATDAGFPGEVVAVINEGLAKNVFPKTDARFGPLLASQTERANADRAGLIADAGKPGLTSNPKVARSTADALVGIGEVAKAIPIYEAIAATDPVAQYRLGVAQALAGQADAATASFAKVQGNRARLAKLWTVHAQPKAAPAAPAAPAPAN